MMELDYVPRKKDSEIRLDKDGETDGPDRYPIPRLNFKSFKCDINVLGLRNLVSTGLLPIRKAFVKFGIKTLLPLSQAKAVRNVYTMPKEGGSNPNIKTSIQFEVKLPSNSIFCPRMTCDVYD